MRLANLTQAAAYLGKSRKTAKKILKSLDMPVIRIPGHRDIWNLDELDDRLEAHKLNEEKKDKAIVDELMKGLQ